MAAKRLRHEPHDPSLDPRDQDPDRRELEKQILDLQATTELLRRAQDLAGLATYRIDVDRGVITLSPELCRMYGIDEQGVELALEEFRERFYFPEDRDPSLTIAERAYQEGSDFGLASRVIRGDGELIWVRSASSVIRDSTGGTQAVGVVEDVSSFMATQVRLADSESQYRMLAENASDVILRLDADYVIEWASPSVRETLGWDPVDLVGRGIDGFVSSQGLLKINEAGGQESGDVIAVDELEVRTSDGRYLTMGSRSRRVLDESGGVRARVVALRDTNDEVLARRELASSESRYRLLAENMSDFVYQVSYDGIIQWVSQSVEQVLGRRPEDLIGTQGVLLFPEDDWPAIVELQQRLRSGVDIEPLERRYVTAGGSVRWMEAHARSLRGTGDIVLGAVIGVRDCHDAVLARRAAQTLSAGNAILDRASGEGELLKSMCDAAVNQGGYLFAWYGRPMDDDDKSIQVVAESDEHRSYLDGILVSWDDSDLGAGPVGQALREVVPVTIDDWDTDESIAHWRPSAISHGFKSSMSLPVKVGDTLDGVLTVYAGEQRAFDDRAQESLRDLAVQLGFGLGRIRDLASLEESNAFLLTITDNMVEGLLALDSRNDVIFANAAVAALLKWDVAEMIGQNGHRAFHYRHADGSDFRRRSARSTTCSRWANRSTSTSTTSSAVTA